MTYKFKTDVLYVVRKHFNVPCYILECAEAIHSDLMYGPKRSIIPKGDITLFDGNTYDCTQRPEDDLEEGDILVETYTDLVGNTLREYIDGLPRELWVDSCADEILDSEPEGWEDEETGEWIEPFWEDYWRLGTHEIVEALFGPTIAKEFN